MPGAGCGKSKLVGLEPLGKLAHWQGHFFNPLFYCLIMYRCYWLKELEIKDDPFAISFSVLIFVLSFCQYRLWFKVIW
jgi:hypothetical protein